MITNQPIEDGCSSGYRLTLDGNGKRKSKVTSKDNIWMIEGSKPGSFYKVEYVDELKEVICECPAFAFGVTNPCKHVLACCALVVS